MNSLNDVAELITQKNYFIILGHTEPDGDCIGSLFALKWGLNLLGKKSLILLDESPEFSYSHLAINLSDYQLFERFYVKDLNWPKITLIALDSADQKRLGNGSRLVSDYFLINIDHHIDNSKYGNLNYINPKMAATGEIIFDLLRLMKIPINVKLGTALATAIIADTGAFRYQNTTAKVFKIMASLLEIGVDTFKINKALFGSSSYESVKLKGLAFSNLKLNYNGKIAWLKVSQEMLKRVKTKIRASSGLVNYARDIKGVEVGLAFFEVDERKTKVSFRSNNYCPVNEIAAHFGGGGHPRAAACIINKGLNEAITMVLSKVEEYV